jgi:membrane protease YdiL (CAAX protease family)
LFDAKRAGIAITRFGVFVALFWPLQFVLGTLFAAILAGALLLRFVEKRPVSDLGFAADLKAGPELGRGMLVGMSGLLLACVVVFLAGGLAFMEDSGTMRLWGASVLTSLIFLAIPAAAEEALFRGYAFQKLVEGFGAPLATIAASAVFAIAHARNPAVNGFALFNIFLAGVVLSLAYLRTKSLWFATGVHLGWNWAMAGLLDLPVSGLELFDAPLYEPVDYGPSWLTGGAFGPEAGLAGVIGLLVMLGGVIVTTRKKMNVTDQ